MAVNGSKPWRYALVQHPMWLIIAEDSVCAERTPPWGCASLDDYVARLGRGLDVINAHPELRVAFDFSAVELEDVSERFPQLVERIRQMVSRGVLSFVNGTYSQPHLQMLSVESAIRQFEHGVRSIEALTGCRVTCYAAQEPGITPYLPQVLRAVGYATSSTPDFPFGVRLTGGQIQHWDKRWEWLAGDDIVDWTAPDGTAIPLWLKSCGFPDGAASADDRQHGLLNRGRLRVDMPDMVEVSDRWLEERSRACQFVLLDEALARDARQGVPRAAAYLDANYAYCEGVDAEQLSRLNWRAETALLTVEALRALSGGASTFDLQSAWRKLLKSQHHDAYWTGAPELRAKARGWLEELLADCAAETQMIVRRIGADLPAPPSDSAPVVVAGVFAAPHRMPVSIAVDSPEVSLVDEHGDSVPVQVGSDSRATFIADCGGLGYRTCFLRTNGARERVAGRPLSTALAYSNPHYALTVRPDSTLASLSAPGKRSILGDDGGNGWLYRLGERDIRPEPRSARVTEGTVFTSVESEADLGPAVVHSTMTFYHELPWFEVRTELCFDSPAEIGDYFDDRTKLHFAWGLREPGAITHAVGGWPAEARAGASFVASPWVDAGGLAICLFGAGKCWIDEGNALRCVVGWGHNGDRFHNRQGPLRDIMGPLNWAKPMDLRLRGRYTVRYAVWPHGGGADSASISRWAAGLLMPPVAAVATAGAGSAPWSITAVTVDAPGIVPLSVTGSEGGEAVLQVAEMAGKSHSAESAIGGDWRLESVRELDGTAVRAIKPYKIAEVVLAESPELPG